MLNERSPRTTKCPCCKAEFINPISEKDRLQIELELLKNQQENGGLHPEIHEDSLGDPEE